MPSLDVARIFEPDAANADRLGHGGEIRILELGAEVQEARRLLLELDEAERAVVEDDDLHRQAELLEAQQIAHQHGEAAVAGQRDDLPARDAACAPIACAIALAIEPCQNEPSSRRLPFIAR